MLPGPRVELLWFQGCPNHEAAEALLHERMAALGVDVPIVRIEVPDEETGIRVCFPGSPTIRVDGAMWNRGGRPATNAPLAVACIRRRRDCAGSRKRCGSTTR